MPKNRTRKNKMRKGAGITQSRLQSRYPPLPESPTHKPELYTNKEGLMLPPKESDEYKKRAKRLRNTFNKARQQSLKSIILGKEPRQVKRNSYGPIQSYFLSNKNKGFKSPKPEF